MFLRDLDFYGIAPEEGTVKTCSEAWARGVAKRQKKMGEMKQELASLEQAKNVELLAHHCTKEYLKDGRMHFEFLKKTQKHWYEVSLAVEGRSQEDFNKSLEKFGMQLIEARSYGRDPWESNRRRYEGTEYGVIIKLGLL